MATCPTCNRTITNFHCPDCEENERGKTRHHNLSNNGSYGSYGSSPNNTYYVGSGGGGKKLPATPGEIVFNVIAAIVIISIGLFVTYQIMISA